MTSQINPTPEQKQAWLVEYQVCQAAADGQSLSNWAFVGIFLGLITAGFAVIVPKIFDPHNIGFSILITFISVGMLIILLSLDRMLDRTRKRNQIYYDRMRAIEREFEVMQAQLQQEKIGGSGGFWWSLIIWVLSVLWILVVAFVWLEYLR